MANDIAHLGLAIDSSPLVSGTQDLNQFAAAAQKVDTAVTKMGQSADQAGQKVSTSSRASERLTAYLERMDRTLSKIERSMTPMSAGMGRAAAAMEGMASASVRSAGGIDQVAASAAKANDNVERMVRTATAALSAMDRINRSTGVTTMGVSVGRGDDIKAYGDELDTLRAKFNPLFAIGKQYRERVAEIEQAHRSGAIGAHEMQAAIEEAGSVASAQQGIYTKLREKLDIVGGTSKLTGDQIRNLSFQINDATTMALSGASAFQILATQGGQVFQVFQEGPGTVMDSVKALGSTIGGVLSAIGPMRLAIGAATLAAGAFWYMSGKDKAKEAEDALKSYDATVKALRGSFATAADAAESFFNSASADSITVSIARAQGSALQLKASLASSIDALGELSGLALDGGTIGSFTAVGGMILGTQFSKDQAALRALYSELTQGKITADQFADSVAGIRLDPTTSQEGRKLADAILSGTDAARLTEARIASLNTVIDKAAAKSTAMGAAFRSAMDTLKGFGPEAGTTADRIATAFDDASASARTYGEVVGAAAVANAAMAELARPAEEAAKAARDRLSNLSLSPDQRGIAEIRQHYAAEIAEMERVDGSAAAIAAKQRERDAEIMASTVEITRAENARRAGYDLDLRAVTARTAAEKAAIAGERVRIDLIAQGYTASEAAAQAAQASTLSMAQARQTLAEGSRQQSEATERQIAQAQLEFDLVGKSSGEVARLRAEFELLAQAKQNASAAGFDESTVTLTDSMKAQAAEIGRLTEQTQRLNFERDILFDRQQASRSPEDQRIASQLRSAGVEYDSAQGRADAAQLRLNERLHETNDRLYEMRDAGKEAFLDLVDAIGSGEDAISAFVGAFAGIGKQLAAAGLDKIFGNLLGTAGGAGAGGGLGAILGGAANAVTRVASNQNASGAAGYIPTPTSRPEYVAQAAAAVSGQVMSYAGRFNSSVDGRLLKILNEASSRFDMRVEAVSGLRPGDKRFHGQGIATDVQIYGANGNALGNYQDASTFRTYERFAQIAKQVQSELFPELEGMLRWGGYFSGGKGKYGAVDNMHFDLAGKKVGMGGGSWENGLTDAQRRLWTGAQSIGMGQREFQQILEKGTSEGVQRGLSSYDTGGYDSGSPRNPTGATQGISRGQAGMQLAGSILGIAANGYQSGNPISGGISGALGGFQSAGSIAAAFPGLAGVAAPLGLVGGAAIGIISSPIGRRKPATAADIRRRHAEHLSKEGNGRDSDQCILAA